MRAASASSDKLNGNNAERHKRIELTVVARDNLAGKLLGERNTKAVGYGDPASGFKLPDTLPEIFVHIQSLDHAIGIQA